MAVYRGGFEDIVGDVAVTIANIVSQDGYRHLSPEVLYTFTAESKLYATI